MELHPLVTFFIFSIPEAMAISIFASAIFNKSKDISKPFNFLLCLFISSSLYITHLSVKNILGILLVQVAYYIITLLVFYDITIIESTCATFVTYFVFLAVQSTVLFIFNGYIPKQAIVTEKGGFVYELFSLLVILIIEIMVFSLLTYIAIKIKFKSNVRTTRFNIKLSKEVKIIVLYILTYLLLFLSEKITDILTLTILIPCMSISSFVYVFIIIKSLILKTHSKSSITDKNLREIRLDFEHNLEEMANQLKKGEYDKVYESVLYWQDLVSIEFDKEGGSM